MISTKNFTQEQIREINRVNIINLIRDTKTTTKQEIAKALEISIPTVTTNINHLIEEGLVREMGVAESTGGRKPMVLGFVKDARYAYGLYIAPETVYMQMINLKYEVIEDWSFPYDNLVDTLNMVREYISTSLRKHQINKKDVIGVGIALPGVVDDEVLVLSTAPNLGVKDFHFKRFQEALGLKVWIENEANIAAFAEVKVGNAVGIDNLVYVSVTEGIGTGIIIKSHIYKSNKKKAGEFGHTRISMEERLCNCGRTGCWELYASKEALLRYYNKASGKHLTDEKQVFELYKEGDEHAKEALMTYSKYLFYGIENIVLSLNPDYVVIGGDFGKYIDILKEVFADIGKTKYGKAVYEGTQIIFTGLADKGALVGATILPLEALFNYNLSVI